MAIGTTAAILGSAVIGAGASAIGAGKNSKAINKATDAQAAAASENTALQRDIYNQNKGVLSPFVNSGVAAQSNLNALLGLSGDGEAASQAFQTFKNSGPYGFQFNEGMRALNTGYAARGSLQSGAAQKAAINYGQSQASNALGQYMNLLANQQGVGLSAANALAGVGTNYATNVGAINQNAANQIGNGAIAAANNNNAMWGNIAGFGGQALGALSSYGGGQRNPWGVVPGGNGQTPPTWGGGIY